MTTPREATLVEVIEILRRTDQQRHLPWTDEEKQAYEKAGGWSEGFDAVLKLRAEMVIAAVAEEVAANLRLYADHLQKLGEPSGLVEGHRHAALLVDGMQPVAGAQGRRGDRQAYTASRDVHRIEESP